MKVSIITATYNSEKTIRDTLKSLEEQSYDNIEYIIIDGASTDKTLTIIDDVSTRVSIIVSEPDDGIYHALNKGLNMATGDVVGFLHSDDIFAYSNAVSDLVQTMTLENSDAVYADLEYVSQDNPEHVVRLWTSGEYSKNKLTRGWMPPHPTFFMKREYYQLCGFFNLDLKIAADYDSLLRYLWTNNVSLSYLPKVTTKMRVGGASNRSLTNIIRKTKEDIIALRNNNISWPQALIIKNISKIPQFFRK